MLNKLFRNALGVVALGLSCFAAAVDKESVTFNNWEPVQTTLANIESGSLRTNVFTVGGYNLGKIRFSGDVTEINGTTADFGSESRVRVKYPDGRFVDLQPTTTTGYTGTLTFSGEFFLAMGAAAPFGGGTWNFYYINTFDDTPTGGVADCTMNITFTLTDEVPGAPSAIDLGTLNSSGISRTDNHPTAPLVVWYKFVVPEDTNGTGKYVDIDTEGTSTFLGGTFTNDTYIGVYTSTGDLVMADDDDGSDFLSQLTFGASAGDRGNLGYTGLNYDGRDGELAPGTYYLAVAGWPCAFGSTGWTVNPTNGHTGDVVLNIRTNMGGSSSSISGNVNLTDLDPMVWAGQSVTVEILDMGVPVATVVTTIDGSGNFSFPTPGAVTPGTYDITCKHAQFLRKALTGQTVTATGISGLSYNLINGDCDDDNEVGISDYAIISGSYNSCFPDAGFDSRSDLNGDTCCDIADYAILSANYGLSGD
ncbi:MAG: hypothetical protein K1X67_02245 [Fimbriimonadaceae bacterium]|nr:hypothetical protein [Fimbriimonadaceae bacterium]